MVTLRRMLIPEAKSPFANRNLTQGEPRKPLHGLPNSSRTALPSVISRSSWKLNKMRPTKVFHSLLLTFSLGKMEIRIPSARILGGDVFFRLLLGLQEGQHPPAVPTAQGFLHQTQFPPQQGRCVTAQLRPNHTVRDSCLTYFQGMSRKNDHQRHRSYVTSGLKLTLKDCTGRTSSSFCS